MKIFGIGLGRSGTVSLNAALNNLGYKSTHDVSGKHSRRQLQHFDCLIDNFIAELLNKENHENT